MQDDICRIKEEHRLILFKGIRRLFGNKREEVTRSWRELHNFMIFNIKYYYSDKMKEDKNSKECNTK